jgi:hypothetical protein
MPISIPMSLIRSIPSLATLALLAASLTGCRSSVGTAEDPQGVWPAAGHHVLAESEREWLFRYGTLAELSESDFGSAAQLPAAAPLLACEHSGGGRFAAHLARCADRAPIAYASGPTRTDPGASDACEHALSRP